MWHGSDYDGHDGEVVALFTAPSDYRGAHPTTSWPLYVLSPIQFSRKMSNCRIANSSLLEVVISNPDGFWKAHRVKKPTRTREEGRTL